jgi:hypothetical protein
MGLLFNPLNREIYTSDLNALFYMAQEMMRLFYKDNSITSVYGVISLSLFFLFSP